MNGFVCDWALSQRSGRKAVRCKLCGAEFRLGYREYGYWDRNVVRRRARCSGCKFWNSKICVSPEVAQVCYENFIKGYLKGYNQRKSEEKGGEE